MRGRFRPWTETALEACFDDLADLEQLPKIVKTELDAVLPDLLSDVKVSSPPPAYEDVQHDVKKVAD